MSCPDVFATYGGSVLNHTDGWKSTLHEGLRTCPFSATHYWRRENCLRTNVVAKSETHLCVFYTFAVVLRFSRQPGKSDGVCRSAFRNLYDDIKVKFSRRKLKQFTSLYASIKLAVAGHRFSLLLSFTDSWIFLFCVTFNDYFRRDQQTLPRFLSPTRPDSLVCVDTFGKVTDRCPHSGWNNHCSLKTISLEITLKLSVTSNTKRSSRTNL